MTAAQWAEEVAVWLPEGWTVEGCGNRVWISGPLGIWGQTPRSIAALPDLGAWVRSIVGAA